MSERFKELVLKTSDSKEPWVRIPLSPPIALSNNFIYMEKYPRGRRGSPAKGVGCDKRRPGSNPGFSAQSVFREESGFLVVYDVVIFIIEPEMRSAEFVDQCFLKDS